MTSHRPAGEIETIVESVDFILDTALGTDQGQSFAGLISSQIWPQNTFYWNLSDPLVGLLGSIHETMSEATGSRRNSFFPVFNSFSFLEHEHMNEHRDDSSDQQTRDVYSAGEANNGDVCGLLCFLRQQVLKLTKQIHLLLLRGALHI